MRHTKLRYEQIQEQRKTEAQAAASQKRLPVIAVLEDIRSLYNVGSIFRTSDGAHLEAIYTVGYTPHPGAQSVRARKEIEKTALGATRTVPHKHFETIVEAIKSVHDLTTAHKIAALEITENSRSVFDLTKEDFPFALIIGKGEIFFG